MTPKGTHHPIGRRSSRKTKKGDPQEKRQSSEEKIVIPENGSPKTTLKLRIFSCDY